jgi:hypothetical protein
MLIKGAITMASQQTYEQQIEAGKQIVRETLIRLASDLERPQISSFTFAVTDLDFDNRQTSVWDPDKRRIVLRIYDDHLADAPATTAIRHRLEAQIRETVKAYLESV